MLVLDVWQSDPVIYVYSVYVCVYIYIYLFLILFTYRLLKNIELLVLLRSLLIIYFMYGSVHVLIPDS